MECSRWWQDALHKLNWLCLSLLMLSVIASAREVELSDDDLLIVAAKIGRLQIADDLFVYYQPDFTLISLQAFCDMLDFAIEVDPDALSASGWFIDESRTFNLNLNDGSLYIAGQKVTVDRAAPIAVDDFDLYVDIKSLQQWFGIQLELVTSQLTLEISSTVPLPIEQRYTREKNRKISDGGSNAGQAAADILNHYRLFSLPVVDAQILVTHDNRVVNEAEQDPILMQAGVPADDLPAEVYSGNSHAYNLEAGADLLYHQMSLSVNADDSSAANAVRFSLGRRAKDFGQTMWLGSTDYLLGDVFTQGDSLINKGSSGVGLTVYRGFNGGGDPSFTDKLIEGDAPPGWEVELYRNGALVDFQVSNDNGRYRFEDVSLSFGENVFDIKIYGPQGQERSRRERVQVGQNMIKPKEWTYRGALLKENDVLFGDTSDSLTEADNGYFLADYGLSESHSIGFGVSQSAPSRASLPHTYMQASLFSAWSRMSTGIEVVADGDSGSALQLASSTRLAGQELSFEHRLYQDFFSQRNPNGNIDSQTDFNWSSYLSLTEDNGIPINLGIEQTKFDDGSKRLLAKVLMSTAWNNVRLNNEFNFDKPSAGEGFNKGILNINFNRGAWRSRTTLNYDISPQAELRKLTSTLDWQGARWRYQLNVDAGLHPSERDAVGINMSRKLGFGSLSFSGRRDEEGISTAQLSMEFSFGAKADRPWYYFSPSSLADRGRARVQVFVDNDNDEQFSPDTDQPLSGIKFLGRKEWETIVTNDQGLALLTGFNSHANSRLSLEEKSFNDPYLRPLKSSLLISHHGGGYYDIAMPVRLITDVEGYVYLEKEGEQHPAAGVTVRIVDESGLQIQKVKTEFDGYYYATGIPAGNYWLHLEERVQNNPDYQVNTPVEFTADSKLGIVNPENIVITRLAVGGP